MGKKILFLLTCMFMTASMAFAQRQITGVVTDSETGEPLPGASVKVQGTTMGTITDMDGKFSLKNVPEKSRTVIVTFMGMKTAEVSIRSNMNIIMIPDFKAIDEVMVVAYGSQKKSSFTGSAVEVKSEDISKHVASTATTALVGKVAGLQATTSDGGPGSAPTIRLRGIGSMSASSSPLYIVDGAPYEAGIATINPSDIESITVLKDASASAIYGARGANGVIIITTKKATIGQDPSVNFEARWGSNSRLVPQYDVIDNPAEYYETHYKAMYNSKLYHGATSAEAYAFADANIFNQNNGGLGYQVYTVPEGQKFIGTNFKLNPNATLGYRQGDYYYTPDDWYEEAFHNSFRQEYNVSAQGATDRFNYYANLGFLDDGGYVNNSGYKRYSARLNTDYQIKKWLKFTFGMGYTHGDSQTPSYDSDTYGSSGSIFYICNTIAPIYPLYVRNADGTIKTENGRVIYDANQTGVMRAGTMGNAVRDNEYNRYRSTSDLFNGKWALVATPVKGLTLSATLNAMAFNSRANNLYSIFGSASSIDGAVAVGHTRRFSTNQTYIAQYDTNFADDHNLTVLAGYEQYNIKESSLSGSNDHLYSPFIPELNNALGSKSKDVSSSSDSYMTEGFLSRLQYDFKDTYFLSASYRRDASSVFAPGHRWGNFGSVGLAWQLNKMNFMEDAEWVNLLKLKASFGVQGNDGLGWHAYADMYRTSYNEETKEYTINLLSKGNENLTWESSKQWNVGFDFALFKHHLNGSIEFYNRATSDMLYYRTLPLSSGISVSNYPDNVGSMYNRGVEVTLNANIFNTKEFKWDLNLNMTHNRNKITKLDGEEIISTGRILKEGGNIYEAYMVQYAGVDPETGRAQYWKNATKTLEDGTTVVEGREKTYDLTAADKYSCGTTLPKLNGGFGTSFEFKGFDLSAQFTYQLGGQIYDGGYQALMHNGQSAGTAMHRDLLNAWTTENRNSDVPRLSTAAIDDPGVGSQTPIDRFLTSSNYLSLNNLTLGYTLPKTVMSKAGIRNLRLYLSGENLFLLTARQGLDPRFNYGIGSMTQGQGLANGSYATMRSIIAGVSLKF